MEKTQLFTASSLAKIFADTPAPQKAFDHILMLQNEKASFQAVFYADAGETVRFEVASVLRKWLHFYLVRPIPGGFALPKKRDGYYIEGEHQTYPDLLEPLHESSFVAPETGWNAVWVEISGELPSGVHTLQIARTGAHGAVEISVEVIGADLPAQSLIYTNWFYTDCLMSHYGFAAFSDAYWRVSESFLRRAAEYGMNCVLTPLFTPPLDTKVGGERPTVQLVDVTVTGRNSYSFGFEKLEKWIDMAVRCGIKYFEMSHLFTQWGARHAPKIVADVQGQEKKIFGWRTRASGKKYRTFLQQLAPALKTFLKKKGIEQQCIFHVSDEPAKSMRRAYGRAAGLVRELFGEYKIIDALSSFDLYEQGLIQTPVPAIDHIMPFVGHVPQLWAYYCSAQAQNNVSNRFFAMPSARNRVLGLQLYKFDVKGFLHWGYNFYYSQYSKRVIDPFTEPDAGGRFPSGDSFVVYPGENGEPMDSLRLHVFYDALQDQRALQLLESRIGREKTLALLEDGLKKPLTFSDYPQSDEWLLQVNERIREAIKRSLSASEAAEEK